MNPIFSAILNDDQPKVKELLKANPKLATYTTDEAKLYESKIVHWIYVGDTPLHLAAAGHRAEIAQLLLAAGADPNAATNHRQGTPLHYAADGYMSNPDRNPKQQVKTIQYLLAAGANINAKDKNGATPLHRAVRTRAAAAVQFLLESGCDPTPKNNSGSTPFHLAVQNTGHGGTGAQAAIAAQRQIIEMFMSSGISTKIKDNKGRSVLDWARNDCIREILSE